MAKLSIELMEEDYQATGDLSPLASYCRDLYDEANASSYRDRKLREIDEGRKRYDGQRDSKSFPWKHCSNASMMLDAIAVDNLVPRIKGQLTSEEEFVSLDPVDEVDAENVEYASRVYNWYVQNNMKLNTASKPIVQDLLLDGTLDVIPVWTEQQRINYTRSVVPVYAMPNGMRVSISPDTDPQVLEMLGIQQIGVEDVVEERETTWWRVELECVDPHHAYAPDTWENWAEKPYGRDIYPQLSELEDLSEENGGPYKNIDRELIIDPDRTREHGDEERLEIQHSEHTQEIHLVEFFVKWEGEWRIAAFAPERGWAEVRNQPMSEVYWHSRKPVHRFRLFPSSRESMGTGIPEKIKHFSKGVDDLFNQMVDSGTVQIIPFFFYNETPMFQNIDLKLAPGKGIPVGKDSHVFFPNIGVTAVQFLAFIEALLGFFERTVGLSDYTLGRESTTAGRGGETFSGMSLIVQEGSIKHQYTGEQLRDTMEELLTDCIALYAQYLPLDAKLRLFENNEWVFEPVDIQALQGSYDVRIQISDASANKMLARKEAVELLSTFAGNPSANLLRFSEDVLKTYGKKATDKYIDPAFGKMIQAVMEAPEVVEVVDQFMQQRQSEARQQQIAGEAEANIERQRVERDVERTTGREAEKLVDQVLESKRRKNLASSVEAMPV